MEITILGVTTLELLLLFYYFRGESLGVCSDLLSKFVVFVENGTKLKSLMPNMSYTTFVQHRFSGQVLGI